MGERKISIEPVGIPHKYEEREIEEKPIKKMVEIGPYVFEQGSFLDYKSSSKQIVKEYVFLGESPENSDFVILKDPAKKNSQFAVKKEKFLENVTSPKIVGMHILKNEKPLTSAHGLHESDFPPLDDESVSPKDQEIVDALFPPLYPPEQIPNRVLPVSPEEHRLTEEVIEKREKERKEGLIKPDFLNEEEIKAVQEILDFERLKEQRSGEDLSFSEDEKIPNKERNIRCLRKLEQFNDLLKKLEGRVFDASIVWVKAMLVENKTEFSNVDEIKIDTAITLLEKQKEDLKKSEEIRTYVKVIERWCRESVFLSEKMANPLKQVLSFWKDQVRFLDEVKGLYTQAEIWREFEIFKNKVERENLKIDLEFLEDGIIDYFKDADLETEKKDFERAKIFFENFVTRQLQRIKEKEEQMREEAATFAEKQVERINETFTQVRSDQQKPKKPSAFKKAIKNVGAGVLGLTLGIFGLKSILQEKNQEEGNNTPEISKSLPDNDAGDAFDASLAEKSDYSAGVVEEPVKEVAEEEREEESKPEIYEPRLTGVLETEEIEEEISSKEIVKDKETEPEVETLEDEKVYFQNGVVAKKGDSVLKIVFGILSKNEHDLTPKERLSIYKYLSEHKNLIDKPLKIGEKVKFSYSFKTDKTDEFQVESIEVTKAKPVIQKEKVSKPEIKEKSSAPDDSEELVPGISLEEKFGDAYVIHFEGKSGLGAIKAIAHLIFQKDFEGKGKENWDKALRMAHEVVYYTNGPIDDSSDVEYVYETVPNLIMKGDRIALSKNDLGQWMMEDAHFQKGKRTKRELLESE